MEKQSGVTLLEILVSLLLMSVALLGLDVMQATSLREARAGFYFMTAAQQLDVIASRLLLTQGENMAEIVSLWNQQNQSLLPPGWGAVSGAYPVFIVTMFWGDPVTQECEHNKVGRQGCLRREVRLI